MNRTFKSLRNAMANVFAYIVVLLLQFVGRGVFIKCLSDSYLGLNGLFSNILAVLSLSEMGVATAISYELYKPLNDGDKEIVKSIMIFFKKIYIFIGCFIIIAGFVISFFIEYIIKEVPNDIENLQLYFMLYVFNTAISYFYSYKKTLLVCDQNEYISTYVSMIVSIFLRVSQIIVIIITKNYVLFLVLMIFSTFIENLIVSKIVDRKYSYLVEEKSVSLDKERRNIIKKDIIAMLFNRVGSVLIFSTDNAIISKFAGLISVGYYSNYVLIVSAVKNFIVRIFNSLVPSLGNMILNKDKEYVEKYLYRILFLDSMFYGYCSLCFLILLNPFIKIWIGEKYVLDFGTIVVIVVNFYITGMRHTISIFTDALGLFIKNKYKSLIEGVINVAVSIPLTIFLGVKGALLGTIISAIIFPVWYETWVVYDTYLNKGTKSFWMKKAKYIITHVAIIIVMFFESNIVHGSDMFDFLFKFISCIIIPFCYYIVLFRKTEEFLFFKSLIIKKRKKGYE